MNDKLPEIRKLISVARSYVAGEVHFSHVCTAAGDLHYATQFVIVDSRIKKMAQEWASMATRVWPGWARVENPISEQEFAIWIEEQLQVFESSNNISEK